MKLPKYIKEIQRLNGKVATPHRFIPRAANKWKVFFELLKSPEKDENE